MDAAARGSGGGDEGHPARRLRRAAARSVAPRAGVVNAAYSRVATGPVGRSGTSSSAPEAIPQEIEVACVASGLIDHVNEEPPNVDRSDSERGDCGDGSE